MKYWISCNKFTVMVEVHPDTNRIVDIAPIGKCFLGQSLGNLLNWAAKFGGLKKERL